MKTFVIIGGGAAGYFAAINVAERQPNLKIIILEAGSHVLQKVKISGGGRCNVTNACIEPKELVNFYPRGQKELLGPFHQFSTNDTIQWFENHGVALKIEADNRVFPKSDCAQTIIDCFLGQAKKYGVELLINHRVNEINKQGNLFKITTTKQTFTANYVLIATGSSPNMFSIIKSLGHQVIKPIPSLFTFNIKDERLKDLLGISVPFANIKILNTKLAAQGPILITHWGLSGPAILKLSSWGAIELFKKNYQFDIEINWLYKKPETVLALLNKAKANNLKKHVALHTPFETLPKRLWERFIAAAEINPNTIWAELSLKQLQNIVKQLTESHFKVGGKSTFKEEFVTAGGLDLKELNFKRFESKLHPNLFFAGEVLNIDALTGGFNFQNAWTGGFVVANAIN